MQTAETYHLHYSFPRTSDQRASAGFVELDDERNTRTQIVRDIAGGQYENIDRVYLARVGEGFEDVSEEIAVEVMSYILTEFDEEPRAARDFLEEHLGIDAVERSLIESGLQEVA